MIIPWFTTMLLSSAYSFLICADLLIISTYFITFWYWAWQMLYHLGEHNFKLNVTKLKNNLQVVG